MSSSVKHLYKQFKPEHYILRLEPNKKAHTFTGKVTIDGLKIGPTTKRIVLHQKYLKISEATITYHEKKSEQIIEVTRINHHDKYDEVRLHTDDQMRSGRYTIELSFSGKITELMHGLYPCKFTDKNNKKHEILATQLESHHAREVFPCIDEPEAKATFDLILTTQKGETVIANTPISTQTFIKSKVVTSFETTPKMSTYLLAFIVGEMSYKEVVTKEGTKVRAYAVADKVDFVDFALEVATKCLDFYNDYFGIPYPLNKCDLVALPDFAAGAMENWGCITFREQTLLVDPDNTSLSNRQYVALVVAHELAHQWFGNLVTMRWWTDLWLNEGFASWMEYFAIDKIFPEWQLWVQFAVDEQHPALSLDALKNTHPIEVTVKHPDEIRTIFDTISYNKGASVINMLHRLVTPELFQKGLRHYLNKNAYGNTDTLDLWEALEEVSHKPVKKVMNYWTSHSGFPLITCSFKDNELTIEQDRFFLDSERKTKDDSVWPVYLNSNSKELPEVLDSKRQTIKNIDVSSLKLNISQNGFYRVIYDANHLERLGELISKDFFEPLDRLGILSDVIESAKATSTSTYSALSFVNYFKDEDNFAVWDIIASGLGSIKSVMNDDKLREDIKPFVRKLVKKQFDRLGWDQKKNDSHFDKLLRPIILSMAASADQPEVVKKCLDAFKSIENVNDLSPEHRTTPPTSAVKRGQLDPDLRGTVFGTVARLGGKPEFMRLLHMHNTSTMSEEKNALVAALTNFKQKELIEQSLSMIKTPEVRLQDVSYWVAYSFMNHHAKRTTWQWLKTNWDWLDEKLGTDLAFYRMPIYAARCFSDVGFIEEYEQFFKPRLSPALKRSYDQGLEIINYQSHWKTTALDEISHFFKERYNQT